MRRFPAFLALLLGMAAAPALAQIQPEVTVNPNASGTRVLLYPGGQYGRVQKDLLQPGEPDPNAPIVLHMPRKHPVPRVAAKPAATPKPKTEVASAPPPPPQQTAQPFSSIPKESAASLLMQEATKPAPKPKPAPPPKPAVAAKPVPSKPQDVASFDYLSGSKPAPAPPPQPTRTASIDTNGAQPGRHSIIFAPGAEEPPVSVVDTIRGLSAGLNAALTSGTAQIRIEAFGGKQNDKSSDARRLSLKRALIIRQLLIDDGVPSERIVVQAMGGAASGALDRVDIFVAA